MSSDTTTYSMILCTLMSQRGKQQEIQQQEFFQKSGIATGTWSRIMRGQAHFQIEDIRAACRVLGCSIGELTSEADKMQVQLAKKEGVKVVSKDDLKSGNSSAGAMVAGAALAFLLLRLAE
ncbi:MAG: helix-turn-helix domain-containing protein [Cognatishimia sp.]